MTDATIETPLHVDIPQALTDTVSALEAEWQVKQSAESHYQSVMPEPVRPKYEPLPPMPLTMVEHSHGVVGVFVRQESSLDASREPWLTLTFTHESQAFTVQIDQENAAHLVDSINDAVAHLIAIQTQKLIYKTRQKEYADEHDEYNQKRGAFAERVVKLWRSMRNSSKRK